MGSLAVSVESIGKPDWRAMLAYVAALHCKSIRAARPPFPNAWEEIGPGYCYGPAFGHWDIVHAILDALILDREHARRQIENNLAVQQDDGLIPGGIWMRDAEPNREKHAAPPVWPFGVQDYADLYGPEILRSCYGPLVRQIRWFENHRRAEQQGFFYKDILTRVGHEWESGVDEGIRFLEAQAVPRACVDATAHVFALYDHAARWADELGEDGSEFAEKAEALMSFIQQALFAEETGFFHDIWGVENSRLRRLAFEGIWPMVVGAATPEQAHSVTHRNLLNPGRFFSKHPITTVSLDDPGFELRMWRGPVWNSMTYWAARGCVRYGFHEAAGCLLERALDDSALQFERTGTIWEFYHPHGGKPEDLQRKPITEFNMPCRDYLGSNPLIAMAALDDATRKISRAE